MGADQFAEIRPLIRELFAGMKENENLCLTLEVTHSEPWIQITSDTVNLYWPFDEIATRRLEDELKRRFPVCELLDMKEGVYATYKAELPNVTATSHTIDWIFEHIYKAEHDYSIDAKMITL